MAELIVNPDCVAGKHANCDGGWDVEQDAPTSCPCACHDETERPIRIQQSRAKGWRKPAGAVAVHRNTRWGNPFRVTDLPRSGRVTFEDDRAIVVQLFCEMLEDPVQRARAGYPSDEEIRYTLAGRTLMCWCPFDQPCHADVLLELANVEAPR